MSRSWLRADKSVVMRKGKKVKAWKIRHKKEKEKKRDKNETMHGYVCVLGGFHCCQGEGGGIRGDWLT